MPLGAITAPTNRHDSPLLAGTLDSLEVLGPLAKQMSVHLNRGYDSEATRQTLHDRDPQMLSEKGKPSPMAAGNGGLVKHTNT